mgnify:CR=1 FL=1
MYDNVLESSVRVQIANPVFNCSSHGAARCVILSPNSSSARTLAFGLTARSENPILERILRPPKPTAASHGGARCVIVCVQIASRIQSRVWTDSSERDRESGAILWSPKVNCRIPLGGQKCDTIDEFNVCVQIASRIQLRVWMDNSERERDSGANL